MEPRSSRSSQLLGRWSPLKSRTPASAFRRKAKAHLRSLPAGRCQHQPQIRRHRSRAWRSAANSRTFWAAKFSFAANRARAARSRFTFRCDIPLLPAKVGPGPSRHRPSQPNCIPSIRHRPHRRRSRQHRSWRSGSAHHRRRSVLRAHTARCSAGNRLKRHNLPARRRCLDAGDAITIRRPSRSIFICPIFWAGQCSVSSNTIR